MKILVPGSENLLLWHTYSQNRNKKYAAQEYFLFDVTNQSRYLLLKNNAIIKFYTKQTQ